MYVILLGGPTDRLEGPPPPDPLVAVSFTKEGQLSNAVTFARAQYAAHSVFLGTQ